MCTRPKIHVIALLLGLMLLIAAIQPIFAANPGDTIRVSVNTSGAEGNGNSYYNALSKDGRFVVFGSYATNLVEGDSNGRPDIFVHDRLTGETTRVSVDSNGVEGNGDSLNLAISEDGRYVAFVSNASNLVVGDTNGCDDIFVHDRQTGVTTRVSVDSSGGEADGNSADPAITANGRFVAFSSYATNLVMGDTNSENDIFVHDRQTGETTRVSVNSSGLEGNCGSSDPAISANGEFIAFYSEATNLVSGDTNNWHDVFVYERETGETTRVSVNTFGAEGDEYSFSPAISADGRFVAFYSRSTNFVEGDTNGHHDIFIHDRQTGETNRISVDSSGAEGNRASYDPAISADGRFVAFYSEATNLVDNDTNDDYDIFVHDRQTKETTRVSVNSNGIEGNSQSYEPAISADGRFVTFYSWANNLVDGDNNGSYDIFVHSYTDLTYLPLLIR